MYEGMDDLAVLDQVISAPSTPVVDSADVSVDDTPDVGATIDDAIAAETAAAPAADAPVVDAAKPAPTTVEGDQTASDVDLTSDDLTVKALNAKLATSPEFKALVDKDPELKKQLFYAARRNERASQYDELFQTPTLAKEVKTAADSFYEFKGTFDAEDPSEILKYIFVQTLEKSANGQMVPNGKYNQAMAQHRSAFYNELDRIVAGAGTGNFGNTDITVADAKEAINILRSIEGVFGYTHKQSDKLVAAAANKQGTLPPEVQAQLDELARIKGTAVQSNKQNFDTFSADARAKVTSALQEDVKGLLGRRLPANVAMTDYTKNSIVRDVVSEVEKLSGANRAHTEMFNRTLRNVTRDEAGLKQLVDAERAYAREIFPRILSRLLSENTKAAVSSNAADRNKTASQVNRREIETSGGVSAPSRPDVRARANELISAAKQKGKPLSDMDLVNSLVD